MALKAAAPYSAMTRYGALGARIIEHVARFTGKNTLEAGNFRIEARRIVIATGARPVIPALPGLEDAPYLTSETLFDLPDLPPRLAILGAGAEAAELAQSCRALGAEVMLIATGALLPDMDREAVLPLRRRLQRDGINLLENTRIVRVQALTAGITLDTEGPDGPAMHNASHLLIAEGRAANVAALGLAGAGITHKSGGIIVDPQLRTSNPAVSATGAAIQGGHWPHGAASEMSVLFRNIVLRIIARHDGAKVPTTTGTTPAIATLGLQERGLPDTVAQSLEHQEPSLPRGAIVLRQPLTIKDAPASEGFVKAIIDRKGQILGVTIVAPDAALMITPWALAMQNGLKIDALAGMDTPYGAADEASRRTALQAMALKLRNPWVARMLRLKRVFG